MARYRKSSRRSSGRSGSARRTFRTRSGSARRMRRFNGGGRGRAQTVRLEIVQPASAGAVVPTFGPSGNITGFGAPTEPKTKSRF